MGDPGHIDVLERRINALESIVFGAADKDAMYPKDEQIDWKCIDSLVDIQNKIFTATAGKKKIAQAYEKLPELKKYLDPAVADEMTLSEAAKVEALLAEEDFLRKQAAGLEAVQKLQDSVNSEHVRNVSMLSGKLQKLSQVQIQQQDQAANMTEEQQKMLDTYNAVITLLSKQFVQWDEVVTRLEMTQTKKRGN